MGGLVRRRDAEGPHSRLQGAGADLADQLRRKGAAQGRPVSATFAGTVELQDIDAPNGCRIAGQGNGGIAGFAKGGSQVTLVEEGGETVLSYDAKAEIGGKAAALGGRLVQATSRKLADQFFSAFTARLKV
jgi:carbon monoxide dehydrogenase subunit G